MHKRFTQPGFTIIELLIVIAVIALLSLLTIFAFGNWRERTANAEVKSSLSSLAASLKDELNFKNAYPATVPSTYRASSGVTITYAKIGAGYCAHGTSTAITSIVWKITSDDQTPVAGAC